MFMFGMQAAVWVPLFLTFGILFLYLGAEGMVLGGSRIALRLGVTPLVVGLTVVSFSTSMPEVVSSLIAALEEGDGNISFGNVIGSNICNIGLVFGISALITPLAVHTSLWKREMPLMLGACLLMTLLFWGGFIGRFSGVALIAALLCYVYLQVWIGKREGNSDEIELKDRITDWRSAVKALLLLIFGLAGLVIGGWLLVEGSVALAKMIGMSDRVIGLTVVSVGTAFPELATSLVAAVRKKADISIGNVVGSNVFNALFIVGVVALVIPVEFSLRLLYIDVPVMFLFCLLMWLFLWKRKKVARWQGAVLVVLYIAYITSVVKLGA